MHTAYYEAAPSAMRKWLISLGWHEFDTEEFSGGINSTPTDHAVAAFGPLAEVEGVACILLMLNDTLEPPADVSLSVKPNPACGVMLLTEFDANLTVDDQATHSAAQHASVYIEGDKP